MNTYSLVARARFARAINERPQKRAHVVARFSRAGVPWFARANGAHARALPHAMQTVRVRAGCTVGGGGGVS